VQTIFYIASLHLSISISASCALLDFAYCHSRAQSSWTCVDGGGGWSLMVTTATAPTTTDEHHNLYQLQFTTPNSQQLYPQLFNPLYFSLSSPFLPFYKRYLCHFRNCGGAWSFHEGAERRRLELKQRPHNKKIYPHCPVFSTNSNYYTVSSRTSINFIFSKNPFGSLHLYKDEFFLPPHTFFLHFHKKN